MSGVDGISATSDGNSAVSTVGKSVLPPAIVDNVGDIFEDVGKYNPLETSGGAPAAQSTGSTTAGKDYFKGASKTVSAETEDMQGAARVFNTVKTMMHNQYVKDKSAELKKRGLGNLIGDNGDSEKLMIAEQGKVDSRMHFISILYYVFRI